MTSLSQLAVLQKVQIPRVMYIENVKPRDIRLHQNILYMVTVPLNV